MCPSIIAIDGPAASGKSTIGYHLAQYLDYVYLDTGVLYRAVTWAALEAEICIEDEDAVTQLAGQVEIDVRAPHKDDGRQYTVCVGDEDVTWSLRTPEVDGAVSQVSVYPGVREVLTERMREMARRGHIVMVGRDIGTVVVPQADMKLYVVASAEERAHRRLLDQQARGKDMSYEDVLENIRMRDQIDSSRDVAPLQAAEDAVVFDTTSLSKACMLQAVEDLIA